MAQPVQAQTDVETKAIDAVITWVDGADPAHQQKLDAWLASMGVARPPSAHSTRFNNAGEIDFCVHSLLRFAPWLRKIHIVVDAQRPAILERLKTSEYAARFNVVDHREIFRGFEQNLPTFNSRSIISMLWRIEGLAEQFIYFNDDMFLLRDVAPADFFRVGKPVLRGEWRRQSGHSLFGTARRWFKRLRGTGGERAGNLDSQQLSARVAGFNDRYYRMFHNPYPMRRSTLQAFFAAHPGLLMENSRYRLRSDAQFKTEVLAAHLEIRAGSGEIDNRLHVVQLKPSEQLPARVRHKLHQADKDPSAAFVCVQSLEMAPPALQEEILEWLDRRIGNPVGKT